MPLTPKEEKAVYTLLDALTDWPCEPFPRENGGKHFEVDYTVAKARKAYRAYLLALDTFPQFEAQQQFRRLKDYSISDEGKR